ASINRGPASGFSWQDRTGLEAEFNIKSWRRVPVGEGNKETGPAKEASPNFRNCDPSDASEDDGKVIAQIAREMAAHEDNSASSTKRGETQ
ncbi:hypothetical protein, partial [Klebsiella pneumoniae]|uniref:hypothetical protein n=1 Tax=Klebsiella pneumoniae TaxID=573 RepID=UPI0013D34199